MLSSLELFCCTVIGILNSYGTYWDLRYNGGRISRSVRMQLLPVPLLLLVWLLMSWFGVEQPGVRLWFLLVMVGLANCLFLSLFGLCYILLRERPLLAQTSSRRDGVASQPMSPELVALMQRVESSFDTV
jgi:hypothetical protein